MPAFTGAEAPAAACPSHGRCFSLLPPHPSGLPLAGSVLLNGTPQSLPLEGFAPLNDAPLKPSPRAAYLLKPSSWGEGGAQRRMRDPPSRPQAYFQFPWRRQPPPTHCGASRRNGRDLIIATRPARPPLPSLLPAAAAQAVQAVPRTDDVPRRTNSAKPAPPNLHLPAPRQGILRP